MSKERVAANGYEAVSKERVAAKRDTTVSKERAGNKKGDLSRPFSPEVRQEYLKLWVELATEL